MFNCIEVFKYFTRTCGLQNIILMLKILYRSNMYRNSIVAQFLIALGSQMFTWLILCHTKMEGLEQNKIEKK